MFRVAPAGQGWGVEAGFSSAKLPNKGTSRSVKASSPPKEIAKYKSSETFWKGFLLRSPRRPQIC